MVGLASPSLEGETAEEFESVESTGAYFSSSELLLDLVMVFLRDEARDTREEDGLSAFDLPGDGRDSGEGC